MVEVKKMGILPILTFHRMLLSLKQGQDYMINPDREKKKQ